MKKLYVISCEECESDNVISESKEECPNCGSTDIFSWHIATTNDYVQEWSNDLENANRHSLTDMPDIILQVLNKYVKNEKIVAKIIKEFYTMELGVD
jgi:ribosomal protein S27AE